MQAMVSLLNYQNNLLQQMTNIRKVFFINYTQKKAVFYCVIRSRMLD